MGTPGNDVTDRLQAALDAWSAANASKAVKYIRKVLHCSCSLDSPLYKSLQ